MPTRFAEIPTYADFARSAKESYHPELWEGRVLDLVPVLGNTGERLMDISGYGNDGTLTNMDPGGDWIQDPELGGAIDFVSSSNDQILCGSNPILDDMSQFSLLMWVCVRTRVDGKVFISKSTTGGNFGWSFKLSGTGGQYNFIVDYDGATDLQATWGGTPSGTTINANEWCHLAITWDGGTTASSALKAYKDAVAVTIASSNNGAGSRQPDASYTLAVGNVNGSTVASPDVLIGRTTLYNRVVPIEQVRLLFERPYCDLMPIAKKVPVVAAGNKLLLRLMQDGLFAQRIAA